MTRHLLVIGGQRCGTTTLHGILDSHPDIAMARPVRPEPKVFCSDEATDRGLEWYRATWFSHARDEELLGDKSTSYIEDPLAPARAARMLGDPEVVAILRDPVERAVSNWRFSTDNGFEDRPLEVALRDNLANSGTWDRAATSVSPYAYLERGRYVDHLAPWLDQFPRTHVLFLADLLGTAGEADRLFGALGVRTGLVEQRPAPALNRSKSPTDGPPATLVRAIRDYFSDSDTALAEVLGRELPWREQNPT
ncbi:sulfotransferase domain-containing protein [Nocardioides terrisoli]|uniref:sulfotransferase domain-containing protein n=1 Tax=Nocardioides terrisoli TaxID=3388267 RepID=UPI00287B9326|nr:sulfotransferase domain-containing protein [Nocardioides marmorisolisilvae]